MDLLHYGGVGGGYIFFETLELLKRGGLYFVFVF